VQLKYAATSKAKKENVNYNKKFKLINALKFIVQSLK
jgi:hypothetical protein